jgi:ParB family chromosome partitioning protein
VVANALRLLNLPEKALELLQDGMLAPGAARAVLGLPTQQQMIEAVDKIVGRNMSVRQAEALIKAMKKPEKPPVEADDGSIKVDYFAEAEKLMEKSVGRKVRIINGRKKGRIEIEYCGSEDLNALIDLIAALNTRKEEG